MADINNIINELLVIRNYSTYAFLGQLITQVMPLDYSSFTNSVYLVASGYLFVILFVDEGAMPQFGTWREECLRLGTDIGMTFLGWIVSQALFRILDVPYFDEKVAFNTEKVIRRCGWIIGFFFIWCTGLVVTFSMVALTRFAHNTARALYQLMVWALRTYF